jgi:hypothetical protein
MADTLELKRKRLMLKRQRESNSGNPNAESFFKSAQVSDIPQTQGTDPSQYVDQNIARSPEREKYDTDVDYSSGIKNQGFRWRFSNLNTDKERALLLNKELGPQKEFWDVDRSGRFILTTSGRQKLGDEGEGKIAIDEEGLSWSDVTDFVGQAGLPILGSILGTVGAVIAAPVAAPLLVASAGAGLGAGLFSFADEMQQKGRGVADEDFNEYGKRAAVETALAAGGELVGGVLFNTIRRLVKKSGGTGTGVFKDVFLGKGATEEGIERAAQLRSLVDEGYTPDITAEGLSNRPIMGINVRIAETLFPGRIEENAQVLRKRIADQLFDGREDFLDIKALEEMVEKFEKGKLRIGSETVELAEQDIKNYLTSAYDNILQKVETEGFDPAQAAKQLSEVQQAFHKTMDDTFLAIDIDMGMANSKLLEIKDLGKTLEEFDDTIILKTQTPLDGGGPVGPAFIAPTNFRNMLNATLEQSGGDPNVISNTIIKKILEPDPEKGGLSHLTLRQVNAIRSYINGFDAEKAIGGDASTFGLGKLREALDDDIALAANKIRDVNTSLKGKAKLNNDEKLLSDAFKQMEKSVDDLEKAQLNYADFMTHQDDASIRAMVRSVVNGEAATGDYINTLLNDPNAMAKFLSGIRKAKSSEGFKGVQGNLAEPPTFTRGEQATLESFAARAGKTSEEIVKDVKNKMETPGALKTQDEITIKNIIERSNTRTQNFQEFGRSMTDTLPALEDKSIEILQKKFFQNAIKKATVDGKFDVRKFGQYIDSFNAKPRVAKGSEPGTAGAGFIDKSFENKTFFEMLFPDGKGMEMIESIQKLNRNIADGEIDNFTFIADDLLLDSTAPNAGGVQIDELISRLKEGKELSETLVGPQSAKMTDLAENQTGGQALRYIAGRSPGEQVQYFRAADKHIKKLREAGKNNLADEYDAFRTNARDLLLARLIDKGSGNATDDVFNALDPRKLGRILSGDGKIAGYTDSELDEIFGAGMDFTNKKIFGKQPKSFREAIDLIREEAELVSSLGGAKKQRGVGLQAATASTNVAGGFLGGNRRQAWNGLTKIGRAMVMARTIQSPAYMRWALTPPETLAQMKRARVALRDAFIQSLNRVVGSGSKAAVGEVNELMQEEVKPRVEEVTERVTESVRPETQGGPEVERDERAVEIQTPRIPVPSPQEISLRGPAMDLSSGNIERDIALGAAGTNPTTQALLRARGRA